VAVSAVAAILAVLAVGQAVGAVPSRYALRQVSVADYPVVHLVVRGAEAAKPPAVFENGRMVNGLDVQSLGESKAIVLAIDRSKSMRGAPLDRAAAAAKQFLREKQQSDRVAVVAFGSTALTLSRLQQATIDADIALRTLATDKVEGTALADAIVVSAGELGSQGLSGRVIILLTDGRDIRSLATFDEAVRAARRSNAVVYSIALGDADRASLARLARATGGAVYASPTPTQLESVYRKVGAELKRTWRISYTTAARPGESITVRVGSRVGPGQTVAIPGESTADERTLLPGWLVRGGWGVVLLLLAVGTLVYHAVGRAQTLPRAARVKRLVRDHTDPRGRQAQRTKRRRPTFAVLLTELDQRLRGIRRFERIERLVERAAVPVSASTVVVGSIVLAIVLALVGTLGLGLTSAFAMFVIFALGLAVPFVVLEFVANRRIHQFEAQLPDVLSTIAGSLRVGHGLKASLQGIADEGAPPISTELRRVLAEARLGRPLEESLIAMCERLGSDDLLYVATAVEVQSQVGGSLAGLFSTVADTVRQRQQHRTKVRALTASGRASASVLIAFPIALVLLMLLINPDYMLPFIQSGIGQLLMAYSVASMAIGAFILSRIVNVKG
jgi:tight adherence protein B